MLRLAACEAVSGGCAAPRSRPDLGGGQAGVGLGLAQHADPPPGVPAFRAPGSAHMFFLQPCPSGMCLRGASRPPQTLWICLRLRTRTFFLQLRTGSPHAFTAPPPPGCRNRRPSAQRTPGRQTTQLDDDMPARFQSVPEHGVGPSELGLLCTHPAIVIWAILTCVLLQFSAPHAVPWFRDLHLGIRCSVADRSPVSTPGLASRPRHSLPHTCRVVAGQVDNPCCCRLGWQVKFIIITE